MVLFEEFVPLEYRQQLAKDSGGKRRLPFLFSQAVKPKQWKPAATLNGRPYVVGHVPKSPSFREVEFEGLLRSNGSKVLTLSKPVPPLPTMLSPSSPTFPKSRPKSPRTNTQPQPPRTPIPPEKPLERATLDAPSTSSSHRRSLFRLPVPNPATMRRSGLVPAEYSTVDFETRLAGYSDDEVNETASMKALTPAQKRDRRLSRDDAWVDILVASQNRRMGSQEVERRGLRGIKGGQSDPELASQEVAQVLAGVRARSPLSEEEEVQIQQTPAPASSNIPPSPPSEQRQLVDPDIDTVMSCPKEKRVGYFDLHPERRPGASARSLPVGPPVNGDYFDGDDIPDEMVFGVPQRIPEVVPPRPSFESASEYAPTSPDTSPRDLEFPEFNNEERRGQKEFGHSRAESSTLPYLAFVADPQTTPTASPSKTAALIQLYREKEKDVLSQSRVPLRSKDALPSLPPDASPQSQPHPSVPQIEIDPVDDSSVALYLDPGRNSPGRYEHGLPLANVLEEDEELEN